MGTFNNELNKARNESIYGPAQKATFLNDQNDLASAATKAAMSGLARMGRSKSGAADTVAGNIQQQRMGNISDFYTKLPFMESEARWNRVSPLLTAGMNWAGRAPVDQNITGSNTSTMQQQTQQQQQGAPWWNNMLYGVAGQLGRTAAGGLTGGGGTSLPFGLSGQYNMDLPASINYLNPYYNGYGG